MNIGPIGLVLLIVIAVLMPAPNSQATYDLVIRNGRVIDPESRTDAVRNLGISNGVIKVHQLKQSERTKP
jgi:hypothetical protein